MTEQKVSFRNTRGLNLVGILHTPEKPANRAVIIAHGFTSNKDGSHGKFPKLAEKLMPLGFATLRFDFSGCGESQADTITVAKQVKDLKDAIKFMRSKGYSEIALTGSSLGGLDCLLAYDEGIITMVLWAPVTKANMPSAFKSPESRRELKEKGIVTITNKKGVFRVSKEFLDERTSLNLKELLYRIACPVLIVHGDHDKIIPLEDSRETLELLPKGSRLEVIKGADHHFTGRVDEIIGVTVEWIKKNL